MPPKLTPAERRRQEREERERIQREKEEAEEKARQEEEERRRIKEEKQRQKDLAFSEAEKVRLSQEEVEMTSQLLKLRSACENAEKDFAVYEEWYRFTECSEAANPLIETEITNLLSRYEADKIQEKLKVQPLLDRMQETEDLNNKLLAIKEKAKVDDNHNKIEWVDNFVQSFRKITARQVDHLTCHMANAADQQLAEKLEELRIANENAKYKISNQDHQKPEVLMIYPYSDIGYGIWIFGYEKTGPRPKPIDFKELNVQSDIPRTLVSIKLILRVWWTSYDYLSPKEYNKEMIVGGILDVSFYNYLTQPEETPGVNYKMKKIYEGEDALVKHPYPAPDANGVVSYQAAYPMRIYYTLPPYLYIGVSDKIKVVLWDKTQNCWNTERIEELKFDFDSKMLTVSTQEVAPQAFCQERAIDFPYKSWKIRRISNQLKYQPNPTVDQKYDSIILDLECKRMSLRFEITYAKVYLRNKTEPELKHIVDKPFDPSDILYELHKSGINLLPCDEDAETSNIPLKNVHAEHKAIQDISYAARNFYIASSRWNLTLPSDQIGVRMRPNPECDEEFLEDQEKDWMSIAWWENKCAILRMRESQETPIMKRIKGTLTHSNLYLLLRNNDLVPPESLAEFYEAKNALIYTTLQKFLMLTKILSFSLA